MNSCVLMIAAVAAVGVASLASGSAGASTSAAAASLRGHVWGTAKEVPGTAALNQGGDAGIASVSCASAGNCSAGGSYQDSSFHFQAFVVSQVNGTWGTAIEVPGTAALNTGAFAGITSVSCASVGNCSASGSYEDSSGDDQVFVVNQVNGTWGTAIEVPGTAALNTGGDAGIGSVSCGSAGNCSAGGEYTDSSGHGQAYVVSQVNGTWGTAIEVPGTGALNQAGGAFVNSVSCASAGNCSAGGGYEDSPDHFQTFVASQVNGTWGTAIEVPGTAALNRGGYAQFGSVSCAAAGNCSAGGSYADRSGRLQAFVVSQTSGTWGTAIEVPGTAALNGGGGNGAGISSVSCASAGNCGAGGSYAPNRFGAHRQVFVVSQVNGTWDTAIEVPGSGALNRGGDDFITVSCGSAGNCGAGGSYTPSTGNLQAFVVSQTSGTWGKAIEVPGTAALNQDGYADTVSVSCAAAGKCSAGGSYLDGSGNPQAFVVSEK
jgi:hypothetical protein